MIGHTAHRFIAVLCSLLFITSITLAVLPGPGMDWKSPRTPEQSSYSALPAEAAGVLAYLQKTTGAAWSGYARNDGFAAFRVNGTGLRVAVAATESEAYSVAQAVLLPALHELYQTDVTLIPLAANGFDGRWDVHFHQSIDGVPVHNTDISFRNDRAGRVPLLQLAAVDPKRAGHYETIGEAALRGFAEAMSHGIVTHIEPVWFAQNGSFADGPHVEPAVYVECDVAPDHRPALYLSARTGELLGGWNRVNFDVISATVRGPMKPHYMLDVSVIMPMIYDSVRLANVYTVSDTAGYASRERVGGSGSYNGYAQLRGLYANCRPNDRAVTRGTVSSTGTGTRNLLFTQSNSRTTETNMYYHMNLVHSWYKALDPRYTALDYAMPGEVDIPSYDNAYWDGHGIYFGAGATTFNPFAYFCDVIYHEYTHGVTDGLYPSGMLPYVDQPGSMNEGWSDYFACTITNESRMGEGGLYTSGGTMRNLQNVRRASLNWTGEVHDGGEIFGAALWDTRTALGARYADSLLHFSKYSFAETFVTYLEDVLEHDDNDGNLANGSPNSVAIYHAFDNHGMGPSLIPALTISNLQYRFDGQGGSTGNSNQYFEPGETMAVSFAVRDNRILYPPPATNVVVRIECSDPGLQLSGSRQLGTLVNGRDTTLAPFFVTYNSGVPRYANLLIVREADGGYRFVDTLRVLLGAPAVAVVGRDSTARFVQNALDILEIPYYANPLDQVTQRTSLLRVHSIVIWLGGNSLDIFSSDEADSLCSFLDRGGKLLLSSRNLSALQAAPALLQRLHCDVTQDGITHYIVDRTSQHPLSVGRLYLTGSGGAGNQQNQVLHALSARTGGDLLYRYTSQGNLPCAVSYGTSDPLAARSVVFGFGIEGIHRTGNPPTGREELLTPILAWFNGTLDSPELVDQLPVAYQVSTWPNPFNSELKLQMSVPRAGAVTMSLYDGIGRVAKTTSTFAPVGTFTAQISGNGLASGVYYLRVSAPGMTPVVKKVALIK